MTLFDKYARLKTRTACYYAERAVAELGYAIKLSAVDGGQYDDRLNAVADELLAACDRDGTITTAAAKSAEQALSFLSERAKKIRIYCVSHAHIDMNWLWGMQETASTAMDTFRTVLNLMKEYPDFTFSQSQASVYRIVEENDPEMLEEIRQRVREKRWEVTASTWVETDKNMPSGESLARHILYTKRYLNRLFGLKQDELELDFEPDTFGHNWSVPEIMRKGGVKYYYHCRGYEGEHLYRWRSRSGAEVLVYREPHWYNAQIEYDMFYNAPQFCAKYGVDAMLKVYGVGDHGGGPTRRDVERIADMKTWPVMPTVVFGTYHQFFRELEAFRDRLPVVSQELNFVFTGCYTSQSRVKMANRISEERLYEAEALSAASGVLTAKSSAPSYEAAWQKVLFNHFHDILPGSGVIETREYALGEFQKVMAAAQTNAKNAMLAIGGAIDTTSIPFEFDRDARSEGGGSGFGVNMSAGFRFPQAERGNGRVRAYHVFNPTMFERKTPVELTVFDWDYEMSLLRVGDASGKPLDFQILDEPRRYWGHRFFRILVDLRVPAFGYATCVLSEGERTEPDRMEDRNPRLDRISDDDPVLENDRVRAVFDRRMRLVELFDKRTGKQYVTRERPSGLFRYVLEDDVNKMTAWRVGNYAKTEILNDTQAVRITKIQRAGLRQWIDFEIAFLRSKLQVTVSLDQGSAMLRYAVTADWHEIGRAGEGVPQLNFWCPLAYPVKNYRYDLPFGVIDRPELRFDVPANSYMAAPNAEGGAAMLAADTKYGFRGELDSMAVDLIRSSYDPDPYPEYGVHSINLGLAVSGDAEPLTMKEQRDELCCLMPAVAATRHAGSLPLTGSLMAVSGGAVISAVKTAEESPSADTLVVRLYNPGAAALTAKLDFRGTAVSARMTDVNENPGEALAVSGGTVTVPVGGYEVASVLVTLKR